MGEHIQPQDIMIAFHSAWSFCLPQSCLLHCTHVSPLHPFSPFISRGKISRTLSIQRSSAVILSTSLYVLYIYMHITYTFVLAAQLINAAIKLGSSVQDGNGVVKDSDEVASVGQQLYAAVALSR